MHVTFKYLKTYSVLKAIVQINKGRLIIPYWEHKWCGIFHDAPWSSLRTFFLPVCSYQEAQRLTIFWYSKKHEIYCLLKLIGRDLNIVTGDRIGFERKYYIIDLVWKDEFKKKRICRDKKSMEIAYLWIWFLKYLFSFPFFILKKKGKGKHDCECTDPRI